MSTENLKKTLLKRDAEWSAAASAGKDIDLILSYWTEDAMVMPPGTSTIKGREELRAYIENSLKIPGFRIEWHSDDVKFSSENTMAYVSSRNRVSMEGPDGSIIAFDGRAVTIWRLDYDDEWRCAVDIWNSEDAER